MFAHRVKEKKLKYVIEARLPLPSHNVLLCVRAEGSDNSLGSIAFNALQNLLEARWRNLGTGIQKLLVNTGKRPARERDASGRYTKSIGLPYNFSDENIRNRERLRLGNTFDHLLSERRGGKKTR
jgi:hypothetical protein